MSISGLNQGVTNIGANAVILYDKSSDKSQIEKIKKGLDSYGIKYVDYEIFKGIEDVLLKVYLGEYPPLIITVDSNINGLSNKNFDYPVVFCPQENFNLNELGSDNPNAVIKRPDNVVKFAAQMFSYMDDKYIHLLQRGIDKKSHELMEDNARINRKYLDRMLEIRTRGN